MPDAPTMVVRLTLPAAGEFPDVAADLAVKIAEHLGRSNSDAQATGETIQALVADVAPRDTDSAEITFEFHQVDDELRIEAKCAGRSSQARHPLPT
jgi:hypothetical protein